jgi:hypothetical protein
MASNFGPPDYMYTMTIPQLEKFVAEKRALADKYQAKRGPIGNHARQQWEDAASMLRRRQHETTK